LSPARVEIYELIAWDLDDYTYRDSATQVGREEPAAKIASAQQRLAERECHEDWPALLAEESESVRRLLTPLAGRPDLHEELNGLDWTLGVVDLRRLLAFQRRLVFDPRHYPLPIPAGGDWAALTSLALGSRRSTNHHVVSKQNLVDGFEMKLSSSNPDLQARVRPTNADDSPPFLLFGGSPFFEVAEFRGRWFLRDGYHRAYRLLQTGVHRVPAVVIYARTIEEVGATGPWFFSEGHLFSDRPPRVIDFLDEIMVLRYERPVLRKVIRIRVEESLEPIDEPQEVQGETI
jgi:hypothetical protein